MIDSDRIAAAGLNANATMMMLTALDDVYRFRAHPVVTFDHRDTTAGHTQDLCVQGDAFFDRVRSGDFNPEILNKFKNDYYIDVLTHDFGEVVKEPMTATGETDPVFQAKLRNYVPAQIEARIAQHFFRYACYADARKAPEIFFTYIEKTRDACIMPHDDIAVTPEEVFCFYQNVTLTMGKTAEDLKKDPLWQAQKNPTEKMMVYYNHIEKQESFIGKLAKLDEKHHGTAHVLKVLEKHPERSSLVSLEEWIPMFGRYEKGIPILITSGNSYTNKQMRKISAAIMKPALVKYMTTSRDIIALHDRPDITALYDVAIDNARNGAFNSFRELRGQTLIDHHFPKKLQFVQAKIY